MNRKRQIVVDTRRPQSNGIRDPRTLPAAPPLPPCEPLPRVLADRSVAREIVCEPSPQTRSSWWTRATTAARKHLARIPRPRLPDPPEVEVSPFLLPMICVAAAGLGALLMIAGHHRSARHPVRAHAGAVARHVVPSGAVGMPIPIGRYRVRPIRIVLDVSHHAIPARERRALGEWIESTQNPATRIRIERRGRLSHPLTGTQLAARAVVTTAKRGDARDWLEAGARRHRAGALLVIGRIGSSRELAPEVRESDVPASAPLLHTYRLLASEAAREIMVTSHQGYGGTTPSGG